MVVNDFRFKSNATIECRHYTIGTLDSYAMVVVSFVTGNAGLVYSEPLGKISLRDALRDSKTAEYSPDLA